MGVLICCETHARAQDTCQYYNQVHSISLGLQAVLLVNAMKLSIDPSI